MSRALTPLQRYARAIQRLAQARQAAQWAATAYQDPSPNSSEKETIR